MARWKLWCVACLGLLGAAASNAAKLTTKEVDLGEIRTLRSVLVPVQITNTGDAAVTLREIKPIYSMDRAVKVPATIAPGATATVELDLDLSEKGGIFRRRMGVFVDQEKTQALELVVTGYAWSPLTNGLQPLDLGPIDLLEPVKTTRWEIPQNMSESQLKVVGVSMKPEFLDTRISADGRALEITPNEKLPLSSIADRMVVRLGDTDGSVSDVSFRLSGTAFDRVASNADVVSLGLFESNKQPHGRIVLTDRKNQKLKIDKLEPSPGIVNAKISECVKKDKSCKQLDFDLRLSEKTGQVNESVTIHVDGLAKPVIVRVSGLRAAPGTKVVEFSKAAQETAQSSSESTALPAPAPGTPLIAQMRKAALPPPVLDVEPGEGPVLKWQVEQESQALGYAVFRADQESGPFLRVSKPMIKRISAESSGASYAWRDKSAEAGHTYWYYVTTIYTDGRRERLSPILKKTVAAAK